MITADYSSPLSVNKPSLSGLLLWLIGKGYSQFCTLSFVVAAIYG